MMYDLSIKLDNRPGALADMGEALGKAEISVEGGGAFVVNGQGVAHFLFEDGNAAKSALEDAGIQVLDCRQVLVQRLAQEQPGQLGRITRLMAEANVNIESCTATTTTSSFWSLMMPLPERRYAKSCHH